MKTKSYPSGFSLAISDVSGGVCEICSKSNLCSNHHIWGRGAQGKTINRLWNAVKLCFEHHRPGTGSYEYKLGLFSLHLKHLMEYCQKWNKKPNAEWTRLEPGTIYDLDGMRQQMWDEGIKGEM